MWTAITLALKVVLGPVFEFLNKRVDSQTQIHIADTKAISEVGTAGLGAIQNADNLNSKRAPWEPIMILAAVILTFFAYHTAQVVLDSVPWHLTFGAWYLPEWKKHVPGSWDVKALPGLFETTEHAVLQSLFVGAAAATATLAVIKAIKR